MTRLHTLDTALDAQTRMRNFKCVRTVNEIIYSAQFDTPESKTVWALEVAFTVFGQWGWRTGARNLPRAKWDLVLPDDRRCRDFAEFVCAVLDTAAHEARDLAYEARKHLVELPF